MILTPVFDIAQSVIYLLPPHYRNSVNNNIAKSIAYGLTWCYSRFVTAKDSDTFTDYSSLTTYVIGDRVKYSFAVYESLTDGNLDNAPSISPDNWTIITTNFIGTNERITYNGRRINFEWALNRYFGTTFRQPDDPVTPTLSDIYITNVAAAYSSLVMYPTDYGSGIIYPTTSAPYFMYDPPVYTGISTYQFDINIPLSVFNALGADDAIRETIVRKFADKYTAVGTFYNVVTY